MEIRFLDKNSILDQIISQNSECYLTKDKKVIQKLDKIFIFEKIKKLSIAHGQGYKIRLPISINLSGWQMHHHSQLLNVSAG